MSSTPTAEERAEVIYREPSDDVGSADHGALETERERRLIWYRRRNTEGLDAMQGAVSDTPDEQRMDHKGAQAR